MISFSPAEETSAPIEVPPELQRLAFEVGVWDTKAKYTVTPDAKTFESRSTETVHWSSDRQFLISEIRGLMPDGWKSKLLITTWSPVEKIYKMTDVSPSGEVAEWTMTVEGNTHTILHYRPVNGRLVRTELKADYTSLAAYNFRCECTDEGKTWTCCEGSSNKRQ